MKANAGTIGRRDIVIFDIDGTLACSAHREALRPASRGGDWSAYLDPVRVARDRPLAFGWSMLELFSGRSPIVFVSGRQERQREVTAEWLRACADERDLRLDDLDLRLRPDRCRLPSRLYKRHMLARLAGEDARPELAVEDNPADAAMYLAAGVNVLMVRR